MTLQPWLLLTFLTVPAAAALSGRIPPKRAQCGTLVLLRHGRTDDCAVRRFSGWADTASTDVNEVGEQQVSEAARAIREAGYKFDIVYTSLLKRTVKSSWLLLQQLDQIYLPVRKTWRLNARSYGALTGLTPEEAVGEFGEEAVASWRRSIDARPPPYPVDHPHHPARERKYRRFEDWRGIVSPVPLPEGESLRDVAARCAPVWRDEISAQLREGKTILVVSHSNTLRALVGAIDGLDISELAELDVPQCIPLAYRFEEVDGQLMAVQSASPERVGALDQLPTSLDLCGEYLASRDSLRQAQAAARTASLELYGLVPRAEPPDGSDAAADASAAEQARSKDLLERWAAQARAFYDSAKSGEEDLPLEGGRSLPPAAGEGPKVSGLAEWRRGTTGSGARKQQTVVIIRHGKTGHNKLGLFTGWEDVPLAPEGRAEAKAAGKLLRENGIEFDVVYTSWLSRAIETAWLVLCELDDLWLPIHKSWRLNERMYGALTGLSKKKTRTVYGEAQFKKWRRSYDTPPPSVSSFSQYYPGNDARYVQNIRDVRISFRETLIRSLERGRLTVHRKLPRTESLKDCMERTIPFWVHTIEATAIAEGKNVLVASSENAIRGLLMHLFAIPPERISEIEIPTGLPLVYDVRRRCLSLLEGDFSDHNFGKSGELLFTPCVLDDEDYAAAPTSSGTLAQLADSAAAEQAAAE